MENCKSCGQPIPERHADRVSIYGIHDCHLFTKIIGGSVDDVIDSWLSGCDRENKYGPTALCPAIVLHGETELRRVGEMVHSKHDAESIHAYREALLADPDIPRLLAAPTEVSDGDDN